ncbi:unnamed protein product [Ceutorhynchus assimilis]|uniref:Ionotropic receptor 75a N-terminal domain-containing protein n=1 Tax=Ceutorhynchus assimilis TaxID=467358 RepID=A0A9N9QNA8_9CUCU|nr:unnamed protein product [Ceutorhynchus assimilis]
MAGFYRQHSINHAVIVSCYSKKDRVQLLKNVISSQNQMALTSNIQKLPEHVNLLKIRHGRLGIVLDGDCEKSKEILSFCGNNKFFDLKYYWLIFTDKNIANLFSQVDHNVDSNIFVLKNNNPLLENQHDIFEFYNPASLKGGNPVIEKIGFFNSSNGYQVNGLDNKFFRRKDLRGVTFKTTLVLHEPYPGTPEQYLESTDLKQYNTYSRYHAKLIKYCQEHYQFSMTIVNVTNLFGYRKPDGSMDGLAGDLERNIVDFGIVPLAVRKDRANYTSDNVSLKLYKTAIRGKEKQVYLNTIKGLEQVKFGHYAFLVELAKAYPFMKEHLQEQLCQIKEIRLFQNTRCYANYVKHSPFRDLFDVCLHRIAESGVMEKEITFWHTNKPNCNHNYDVSTGIEETYVLICSNNKFFDLKYYWLIFTDKNIPNLFSQVDHNVDSNIFVLKNNPLLENQHDIFEFFNPASLKGGNPVIEKIGFFNSSNGYQVDGLDNKFFRRKDLRGVTFKTTLVFHEPYPGTPEQYLESTDLKQYNTYSRYHAKLMRYCQEHYQFRFVAIN